MPRNDVIAWMKRLARPVAALAPVVLVSGCAVGPRFHPPRAPVLASYTRPSLSAKTEASTCMPDVFSGSVVAPNMTRLPVGDVGSAFV